MSSSEKYILTLFDIIDTLVKYSKTPQKGGNNTAQYKYNKYTYKIVQLQKQYESRN